MVEEEILYQFCDINNSNIILSKKDLDKYELRLITKSSGHYCTNGCNTKCHCKDKSWIHDYWGGILTTSNNYTFIYNIYQFILKNMDNISKLNRYSLCIWFNDNSLNFLYEYYSDLYNQLIQFFEINKYIFEKYFYENIKINYINYYKNSIDEDTKYRISYLLDKKNFTPISNDIINYIDIFKEYKFFDINSILIEEPKELFSSILEIYYMYNRICDNLESTLY